MPPRNEHAQLVEREGNEMLRSLLRGDVQRCSDAEVPVTVAALMASSARKHGVPLVGLRHRLATSRSSGGSIRRHVSKGSPRSTQRSGCRRSTTATTCVGSLPPRSRGIRTRRSRRPWRSTSALTCPSDRSRSSRSAARVTSTRSTLTGSSHLSHRGEPPNRAELRRQGPRDAARSPARCDATQGRSIVAQA
jgi:hypothetical protein